MSAPSAYPGASSDFGWNASIVEWLAGIFVAPPSINAVVGYRGRMGAILFEALDEEPGCHPGVQRMRSAMNLEGPAAAVALRLGRAFTQLFDGIAGSKAVSLYESGHVGVSGRLFQAPVVSVGKLLRKSDLSIDDGFCEPSDHLSIELALLARLIRHDSNPGAQKALLDDHLLNWLPAFADRCHECDRTGFYAGTAQVLTAFLTCQRAGQQYQRSAQPKTGVSVCRSD